jgi:DNA-binding NtrC family response regulator
MNLKEKDKSVSILVVDDEFSVRDSLTKWFKSDGYFADSAADANEALKKLQEKHWDIAFLDIKMPGIDGMELQQRIKNIDSNIVVIILTGYASIDTAVKSLKEGAYDYVTKPVDPDYLSHLIEKIVQQKLVLSENLQLKETIRELYMADQIIGESPEMLKVFELMKAVAPANTSVFIRGESGTGKELLARTIHAKSSRRFFPFVNLNCGGLSEDLLESELFGHEKGAMAGALYQRKGKLEMADGGTIFLNEVASLSPKAQTILHTAIETKQFNRIGGQEIIKADFRLISATSHNLELLVKEGIFREDLYYQLNVFTISIPPLRNRKKDLPLLASYFLNRLVKAVNKPIEGLSAEALKSIEEYDWPGNVRELKNAIERAVVVSKGPLITLSDLPIPAFPKTSIEDLSLEAAEKNHLRQVLEQMGWDLDKSAEVLKIDRTVLESKIEKYGLRK